MQAEPHALTVYIIDDDPSVRRALSRLVHSAGMLAVTCDSVDDFLAIPEPEHHACVIADLRMPGSDALRLTGTLADRGLRLPVIMVTAQGTETTRAAAKQAGVCAFFRKPVDDQALFDAIEWAVAENTAAPV
jgi:FixJ family two-component response regulator